MTSGSSHVDIIVEDGNLTALYEDLESTLGTEVDRLGAVLDRPVADCTRRASHVEPAPGGWTADMTPVGGPVLGPVPLRRDALALERRYMADHFGVGA